MRLPIFNDTFWPSDARTCGWFSTLVRLSLSMACNRPPGSVVEKSALESRPNWASVMVLPVVVGAGVPFALVDGVVVVVVPRGAKLIGTFNPAVPAEAIVAA